MHTHMYIHGTHGSQKTTCEFVLSFYYMGLRDWTQVTLDLLSFSTEPCFLAPFLLSFTPVVSVVRQPITFSKGTEKTREEMSILHIILLVTWTSVLFYYFIPSLKIFHVTKCVGGGRALKKRLRCLLEDQSLILSSLIKRLKTACTSSSKDSNASTDYWGALHMYTHTHAQKQT